MGTQLPLPQRGTDPQFSAHISCGQMAAWTKMSLGMELGLGPGDFVLEGDPAPPPKRGGAEPPPPVFGPCLLWPNGWIWMQLVLGMVVGLSPGDFVLDGDPAPFLKRGRSSPPQFSAHFYCGQTAECIKMPLGTDVGLSPGDFVLDGDPVPLPTKGGGGRGQSPPIFGPWLLWPNGWMDQDGTWHDGRIWSSPHCARWGTALLPNTGGRAPQIFGPSLLWPNGWMHQDAT